MSGWILAAKTSVSLKSKVEWVIAMMAAMIGSREERLGLLIYRKMISYHLNLALLHDDLYIRYLRYIKAKTSTLQVSGAVSPS